MPFLAALGPLIGIGTAAGGATTAASVLGALGTIGGLTSAGIGIDKAITGSGQPGQPGQPAQPTPQSPAQNIAAEVAKRQQEGAMVANQTPNLVGNTSGSLSDQSYQTFGSQDTGQAGTFGQGGIDLNSIMQFLGGSGGGSPTNLTGLAAGSIT